MTGTMTVQAQTAPAPSTGGDRGYVVKSGDTLSEIAAAHGVSLRSLEAANPQILHPDLIRPGQHLNIPGGSASQPSTYTVAAGDTLSQIGQRFGVDWHALAAQNGIANPDVIRIGQTLSVGGASATAPASASAPVAPSPATSPGASGTNAATIAEKYLGQNASSLKVNRNDNLPMRADVPSNVCCANFVSAVLTEAGQLPANLHTDSVAQLNTTLRGQGWTPVSAANARPGDVVIIDNGSVSHTVIVDGNGKYIGSNNRNDDGTQRITTGNMSWAVSQGATILRAPASVTARAAPAAAPAAPAAVGAASASQQGRIDQAVRFFEGQGWTHAQAIGIVANLDAESNMNAGIRQNGGGPGYGLAQWEGPRQAAFAAWAGHDIHGSSFEEQLRFVQHELTTSERGAGAALRNTSTAREAAETVTRLYERPADTAGEALRRGQHAAAMANGR